MDTLGRGAASLLVSVATALAILALTIPLFLNPAWVAFEQGRAEATAWTGFDTTQLRAATDAILADLVLGPPDFDVAVDGTPVLTERERGHMRDVRTVFLGFFAVTALLLVAAAVLVRRRGVDAARDVRRGAVGLVVALLAGGAIALVAFDVLFEVFHTLLFPAGSYTFDPSTERLVQLFPFRFWQETAIAVGVLAIVVACIVAWIAGRRLARERTTYPSAIVLERGR